MEPLCKEDLQFIISTMYPMLSNDMIESMVTFNQQVDMLLLCRGKLWWEQAFADSGILCVWQKYLYF